MFFITSYDEMIKNILLHNKSIYCGGGCVRGPLAKSYST